MSTDKKVALITGGNKGIGLETARQLGKLGITVLIGVRDEAKATPAGARGHVDRRGVDADAVPRGLHDGVRLGVDRAHAVAVLHEVPLLVAVREAADAAVVTGREKVAK